MASGDSGEASLMMAREPAFAWLADPRNAGAWFASVRLERPPAPPLRAGSEWRFLRLRRGDRPMPIRLTEYDPSTRFTWETAYPTWRDNLRWTFTLTTMDGADGGADGAGSPHTNLALRIVQRPGPLGWPMVGLSWLLQRLSPRSAGTVGAVAQRAVERARDALEAAPPTAFTAYGYGPGQTARARRKRGR